MGIVSGLQKQRSDSSRQVVAQTPLVSSYYTSPQAISPQWPYSALVNAYKSWVYVCVDKVSKSVAMIPKKLYVYRRQGKKMVDLSWLPSYKYKSSGISRSPAEKKYFLKEMNLERVEVTEHPFLDLMRRPNAMMTQFSIWYETMVRLELGGLCGWLKMRDKLGVTRQVWPLPLTQFALLRPKVSPSMELQYWDYQDGDIRQRFDPKDICLFKYPHPASPFEGMSPLMAQTYPYDIDFFLSQQQRSLFKNGAFQSIILNTEQQWSPEQVREFKEQFSEEYEGPDRAGGILVGHSGLKFEGTSGMTGREAMIDRVAQFARDKLITAYDLSPSKVGLHEKDNRATAEVMDITFVRECIQPKTMLIEEIIETFFLPDYDEGLSLDMDLPDFDDREFRMKERQSNLQTGYSVINEERAIDGKEPVEWGDKPWMPFNLTQIGESKPLPESPPSPDDQKSFPRSKRLTRDFWTEKRKDIYWKMFVRTLDSYQGMIERPMKHYFKTLKAEVINRLYRDHGKVYGEFNGWSKAKVQKALKDNKTVRDINITKGEEAKKLETMITPVVKAIISDVGKHRIKDLLESYKLAATFDESSDRITRWLGNRMRLFSKAVSGTTFDEIEKILKEGFANEDPVTTIASTLSDKFESWDKYRASLISRSETAASFSFADLESVKQSGLEDTLLKAWLSARDDHCRTTHEAADIKYNKDPIGIDEEFEVGADHMLCPGNGERPEENVQCRCTLIYVEKGES